MPGRHNTPTAKSFIRQTRFENYILFPYSHRRLPDFRKSDPVIVNPLKKVSMNKLFTTLEGEVTQVYIIAWAFFSTLTVFALLYV